jgi:hypothetical protein
MLKVPLVVLPVTVAPLAPIFVADRFVAERLGKLLVAAVDVPVKVAAVVLLEIEPAVVVVATVHVGSLGTHEGSRVSPGVYCAVKASADVGATRTSKKAIVGMALPSADLTVIYIWNNIIVSRRVTIGVGILAILEYECSARFALASLLMAGVCA